MERLISDRRIRRRILCIGSLYLGQVEPMTRHAQRIIRRLTGLFLILSTVALGARAIAWWAQLPRVESALGTIKNEGSSIIYDAHGQVAAYLDPSNTGFVPLHDIAPVMKNAIIATEDHNFYRNPGFDLPSLVRALWVDLRDRRALEGASTITEQLAKNLYLSDQKTLGRKLKEFVLGLKLHHAYTKDQILSLYLNTVYLGHGADGIAAAAKIYFDTTPNRLTLPEASLLAGLPQAPSLYDPYIHWRLAKARQRLVLAAMARWGMITPAEARAALRTPLELHPAPNTARGPHYPYPWYVDAVVSTLLAHGFSLHEILDGNLHIYTSLHPRVYHIAQQAVDRWMQANFGPARHPYAHHQAAVVVEDPHTGAIWAIIGGRRHVAFLQADLALHALRSTGSAIKPLLDYAPRIVDGAEPTTVVQDVPQFRGIDGHWWPHNDDYRYRGYITLDNALAMSDNNVAVKLMAATGLRRAVTFLQRRFQVAVPAAEPRNLSLALGIDSNLLTLTQAYAALDNQGRRVQPCFITRVTQGSRTVYQTPHVSYQALTPAQAYLLTTMLMKVLTPHPLPGIGPDAWATGHQLALGRPAAAKSGTSNQEADAWFIGYEPQIIVGVWEGNRVGERPQLFTEAGLGPAYGAVAAGPIWHTIMRRLNRTMHWPPVPFARPRGVVYMPQISMTSGMRPGPATPRSAVEGAWVSAPFHAPQGPHRWTWVPVPALQPNTRWRPGCGPVILRPFLQPEPLWQPHSPKPTDARYWPPTRSCETLTQSSQKVNNPSL